MNRSAFLSLMLTSGGDRRIAVPRGGNTNVYGASPYPRATLGYASSTANDISLGAFSHLEQFVQGWPVGGLIDPLRYAAALEDQRRRIRRAYGLPDTVGVVFAPSGTDLEFVALALAAARFGRPVTNVLLGQDEVGSGCILAAAGLHFAKETALQPRVAKGTPVAGLEDAAVINVPIRDAAGTPQDSAAIARLAGALGQAAARSGRHLLAHVVHGSKTGLVLPRLAEIDRLRGQLDQDLSLVVDACQARIEGPAIRAYLDRGAMVLLTGSKFIGGPPFSGFALVPPGMAPHRPLAAGLTDLFRRAEWPAEWAGLDHLPQGANPGLLLRLEAALFELERYAAIARDVHDGVLDGFGRSVRALADRLGARVVGPALASSALHEATLATLDLSGFPGQPDLAIAQRWCRVLAARGLRLGQPVKCVRLPDGQWAGTLRISLSMPLIAELAPLSAPALAHRFACDMARIADVLEAARRPVVA